MMAYSKLSTSDLSNVRNEVTFAAARWYDIGLELGMTADYLDTIKKANDDPQVCLREMLRHWLLSEPSWEALITALRSPAIEYSALAGEIEKKYRNTAIVSAVPHEHPVSTVPDPVDTNQSVIPLKPRPIPKPRHQRSSMSQNSYWKHQLVQSFEGITSCELSEDQLEKAKQCIRNGGTYKERYHLVEFEKLLDENQVRMSLND